MWEADVGLYPFPDEYKPPVQQPSVISMHEDCLDPDVLPGYSDLPRYTRVIPLARDGYKTLREAEERFTEIAEKNNWKLVEPPFWTARWWCFRIDWSAYA